MVFDDSERAGQQRGHGAVRAGNLAVFNCLFGNQLVLLDVENKDRMTPLDVSCTRMRAEFNYGLVSRHIRYSLSLSLSLLFLSSKQLIIVH
jgi:hypothetical protein